MASTSVPGGVIARIQSFAFPETVSVWLSEVPLRNAVGAAVVPPWVCVTDDGMTPDYDFELNPIETTQLRVEVYALTLAQADAIVAVVRYNGGGVAAGAGLDFAAALPLTGLTLKSCVRQGEQRAQETQRGTDATPVFHVTMRYEVECLRTA